MPGLSPRKGNIENPKVQMKISTFRKGQDVARVINDESIVRKSV